MNRGKVFTYRILKPSLLISGLLMFFLSSCTAAQNTNNSAQQSNNFANAKVEQAEAADSNGSSSEKVSDENSALGKADKWAGVWSRSSRFTPAEMEIKSIGKDKMNFKINASSGANVGEIEGVAEIKEDKAFFDDKSALNKADDDSYGCKISFLNKGDSIEVEANTECNNYGGLNVSMSGNYTKGESKDATDTLFSMKVLPSETIAEQFKQLVGSDYETFAGTFQIIDTEEKDLDNLNAKVITGCVEGLCTQMRSIIMFDDKNHFWAAVTDPQEKNIPVYYYTNDPARTHKLPQTIQKWFDETKQGNTDVELIYKNKK